MLIAELKVWPSQRVLQGPQGSVSLEPLVMSLFLVLAARPSEVVGRRELFNTLWGSMGVGDDSLNRLIAVLRRSLTQIGVNSVRIETVPASGYVLRLAGAHTPERVSRDVEQAFSQAWDSWRLGIPEPDYLRIALLERAGEMKSDDARIYGMLALLHRHAAEYAEPERTSYHVSACDDASRKALALDDTQTEAATALVSVGPLYGRWIESSRRLKELCSAAPGHPVPENDLSVLEMATGQIAAAKHRRDRLIRADPLSAVFSYKSVYQHWSVGDRAGMDHMADRAMQLWPMHPAVWSVRFWTLVYTDRAQAALAMLDGPFPDGISEPMLIFLRQAINAYAEGEDGRQQQVVAAAEGFAGRGPAQAVAALFVLGLFNRVDEGFQVARRYYLQHGHASVPLQTTRDRPRLNEQHRRLTQILFTPACSAMRADARFSVLCQSIGLTAFWEQGGITPDYLNRTGA